MMRIFHLLIMIALVFPVSKAQKIKDLDKSPLDLAIFRPDGQGTKPAARIIYSRPQKKGRTMLGEKVPYGKIWRTGANQSTEINLYRDFTFAGKKIKSGNYTLYTIPNAKEWTIIFNAKLHTWGAYDYDESQDVIRVTVPAVTSKKEREAFGIAFDGQDGKGKLLLAWETTEVFLPFEY